ncbi:M4 family metallopeptidase [Oxalobacteraceae bacterium]|nr:M4 family metallopeptidase [Oxalobacteraceae bacterium]
MQRSKTMLAVSIATAALSGGFAVAATSGAPALMAAPFTKASPQESAALLATLNASNEREGLDRDHGYLLTKEHPGEGGTRIARLQHTYKGIPVYGSDSIVVSDARGNILNSTASERRTSLGSGRVNTLTGSRSFDVAPVTPSQAAIDTVVRASAPRGLHRNAPSAELVIYPIVQRVRAAGAETKPEAQLNALDLEEKVTGYELAWLVKTRMADGGKLVFRDAIVSAKDGRTLAQWNALQTVVGVGHSLYSGDVPIQTTFAGGVYKMFDPGRGTGGYFGGMAVSDAAHSPVSSPNPGTIFSNPGNVWGDGKPYDGSGGANGQTAAVDALWGLMNTYDAVKNTQGWLSLDGQNTATYIAVHVDSNYDNAFYDAACKCMYLGDGSAFNGVGSLDIIGHELGHGITDASSGMNFTGETGGLNESFSDINGEMIEAYAKNGGTGNAIPVSGNDWMIGKDISKTGTPLRWMWKPSKDGLSKDAWASNLNQLDPHYSSGPNNRMFYFLAQGSNAMAGSEMYSAYLTQAPRNMTGIGNDKAYRIWFRANTTKFTSSTNYANARARMIESANELYGAGSKEAVAVSRAYAAINVGADVAEAGTALAISTQPQSTSVRIGTTASFTVGVGSGVAPYKYQWLRNGSPIAGATQASYSFTAQGIDSGSVFAVKVTDSATVPQTVQSNNAVLVVDTGPEQLDLIKNGSFESGAASWTASANVIGSWPQQAAYEGSKYAYLGGNGSTSTETLTQAVTIPANTAAATLSFALHIDSAETGSTTAYDKLVLRVKNSAGAVLGTLATYSNLNKGTGYTLKSFSMLPYKGQTVTLSFTATEDSSLQTSFVVDKVRLIIQ